MANLFSIAIPTTVPVANPAEYPMILRMLLRSLITEPITTTNNTDSMNPKTQEIPRLPRMVSMNLKVSSAIFNTRKTKIPRAPNQAMGDRKISILVP